jgi:hypothetical protein
MVSSGLELNKIAKQFCIVSYLAIQRPPITPQEFDMNPPGTVLNVVPLKEVLVAPCSSADARGKQREIKTDIFGQPDPKMHLG